MHSKFSMAGLQDIGKRGFKGRTRPSRASPCLETALSYESVCMLREIKGSYPLSVKVNRDIGQDENYWKMSRPWDKEMTYL